MAFIPASRLPVGFIAAFVEFTDFDQGYVAVLVESFAGFEKLECYYNEEATVSRSYPLSMNESNITSLEGR